MNLPNKPGTMILLDTKDFNLDDLRQVAGALSRIGGIQEIVLAIDAYEYAKTLFEDPDNMRIGECEITLLFSCAIATGKVTEENEQLVTRWVKNVTHEGIYPHKKEKEG